MALLGRGNDALNINPPPVADEILSLHGSDWLWAVTAVYVFAFIGLTSLCFVAHESKRVFHYLFTVALLVGSITYYAQASDLGWTVIQQADHLGNGATRQIFYVKYINWAVSFPSIALALGLLSGVSWTTILCNMAICCVWVATYLVGAYTPTNYKWGFFAFGTFSWVILAASTLNESREEAARLGIAGDYVLLSVFPNVLWLLYLIAWGLSDGGNITGVTGGWIFFGVLDVLLVPVFTFVFLFISRRWDWGRLGLDFSEFRGPGHHRNSLPKEPREANESAAEAA